MSTFGIEFLALGWLHDRALNFKDSIACKCVQLNEFIEVTCIHVIAVQQFRLKR